MNHLCVSVTKPQRRPNIEFLQIHVKTLFIRLVALPSIPGFRLNQLSCSDSSVGLECGESWVRIPLFSLKKRESCPG